ncbi:uncharacterized protein [Antedon mediterranea]|uniref:uncharacterized protein n=1 Tax=Antedon mediterranea TaxID=105859 RepID=UPI003AF6DB05
MEEIVGSERKTNHQNTTELVNNTQVLSKEYVSSEGKSVRQNSCSVCGEFGHNKKYHKKKCKICRSSGHVSFRCPNKSTASDAAKLNLKTSDELHFPEREKRGTKQDLTQAEMDIIARVLLCCHNEKKLKEIQSVKDISQRASMYTGISKATCAAIYKQLKEGHWPEKGPSKRGKYDRETHNLKKKPNSTTETKCNNLTKRKRNKNDTNVKKTAVETCMNDYSNIVTFPQGRPLNEITVSTSLVCTLPMQITSVPAHPSYSLVNDTSNIETPSGMYANLLGNQHFIPAVCDQADFQGITTHTLDGIHQQHHSQQQQQQLLQQHLHHQQQQNLPQTQLQQQNLPQLQQQNLSQSQQQNLPQTQLQQLQSPQTQLQQQNLPQTQLQQQQPQTQLQQQNIPQTLLQQQNLPQTQLQQ